MSKVHGDIQVQQLLVGPMKNFVYLLSSGSTKECMVVDPAWDIASILSSVDQAGLTLRGALVTHYHPDHCGGHLWGHDIEGVAELIGKRPVPVYANQHEIEGLMKITGLSKTDFKICSGGDKIKLGPNDITTIHTPGHTPGSQCFLCNSALVSGDTLFVSGCGRVDLPGGNSEQLYESLTQKLAKLPNDTVLYPGHDYDDVKSLAMSEVKHRNKQLSSTSLQQWKTLN